MRSNPFRLTLAILGIGFLGVGAFLWLIGTGSAGDGTGVGLLLQWFGVVLLGVGWLPFLGWLIVGALQWVPAPKAEHEDPADDGGPRETMTESEIRARLAEKNGS